MEKALIIITKAVPVTTVRMMIMERILIALKYKKSGNRYYRLY